MAKDIVGKLQSIIRVVLFAAPGIVEVIRFDNNVDRLNGISELYGGYNFRENKISDRNLIKIIPSGYAPLLMGELGQQAIGFVRDLIS